MVFNITVKNFKSISSIDLALKEGLNILIGPNGSGKTCILTSLKFVRDLFVLGAAQATARNGGATRIFRRGEDTVSFSIEHDYGDRVYRKRKWPCTFSWRVEISQMGPEKIAAIKCEDVSIYANVRGKQKLLFRLNVDRGNPQSTKTILHLSEPHEFGRDLFSRWNRMFSSKSKKDIHSEFEERMLRLIIRRARVRPDESVFPLIMRFDDKLQHLYNLFFYLNEYNIHPDTARQSAERLPFAKMQPNGDGVAEVIDALEKRSFDRIELARYYGMESFMGYDYPMTDFPYYAYPHRYDYRFRRYTPTELQRVYKQAFENINKELSAAVKPIESVSVKIDETNGKRFVVFRAGKETFYPQEVSDGTIKWLCILVSIFVPYSSVYILEEPENFLHPWMQQRLISMMREHAKINNAIFVLASHSSTVLNSAFAEEVLIVSQTKDGTKINEIADKEEIERVLLESDFRLGDFWVSGALGGVP